MLAGLVDPSVAWFLCTGVAGLLGGLDTTNGVACAFKLFAVFTALVAIYVAVDDGGGLVLAGLE